MIASGHLAGNQVGGADKTSHEARRPGAHRSRPGVPTCSEPALMEDRDAVAHGQGLFLVVSDEDEGDADPLLDGLELHLHLLPQLQVQRAQRLIQQQDLGMIDQRRGPAQHAGADRPRAATACALRIRAAAPARASHPPAPARRALWNALDHQAIGDVLRHGHVRKERVVLEDGVDIALVGRQIGDILTVEQDAALRWDGRSRRSCAGRWSCRSRKDRAARRIRHPGSPGRRCRPPALRQSDG